MCFTGHRKLEEDAFTLRGRLDRVLEALYAMGYRRFLDGGALGFDLLAAECVLRLQTRHPDVRLVMVIPCAAQPRHWNAEQRARYERILFQADETRVLSEHYFNGCMMVRNRHMVDRADCCVCYLNKTKGGTVSTVAYALSKSLLLLNTAMPDACEAFANAHTAS